MTNLPDAAERNGAFGPGLEILRNLEAAGLLSDTGLELADANLSFDQCEALAFCLGRVKRISSWAIGDLLIHSELSFGELAPQIAAATQLSHHTLENLASISRKIPPHRRREGVPHSIHAAVTKLPPREQTQMLKVAAEKQLTRDEFRGYMNDSGHAKPPLRLVAQDVVDQAVLDGDHYSVRVDVLEKLRSAL